MTLVDKGASEAPRLTSERVGISGQVIYRWKARDNRTSKVYTTLFNLVPFFKMAAKMADFMQTYVYMNNAGYNEAIHILMAKVLFYIKAQTSVASLKRWDCFWQAHFKMAANMAA